MSDKKKFLYYGIIRVGIINLLSLCKDFFPDRDISMSFKLTALITIPDKSCGKLCKEQQV